MSEEISLSLEETNKLRLKAGLKPIPDPTKEPEDDVISLSIEETNKLRQQVGLPLIPLQNKHEDTDIQNYKDHQAKAVNQQKNEDLLQRIRDAKFKSNKRKFIDDKTLIDESKDLDTDDWLKNLGTKEDKPKKRKVLKNQNEEVSAVIGHTAKELKSIGDEEILTLKDSDLLDDEDVLTNEKLLRNSKIEKDLREKKEAENIKFNGRHYRPNDDDGDSDDGDDNEFLMKEKVIVGKSTIEIPKSKKQEKQKPAAYTNLFEDIDELEEQKPKTVVKMKKIKKKSNSSKKKSKEKEDIVKPLELGENDDDDIDDFDSELAQSLIASRNSKLRSRSQLTPEQIAEEIAASRRWDLENQVEKSSLAVYDNTDGFLNNLEKNILNEEPSVKQQFETTEVKETNITTVKESEEEPVLGSGLAATLKFLQSKNVLEPSTTVTKSQELEREEANKRTELLKMKINIEERILKEELANNKEYLRLPKAEKPAYFDKLLDTRLKQKGIVQQNLQVYNPKVELTYKDSLGNVLNKKKAWKEFSHKYHSKK
ncbi:SNU66 66 kDa U4/U6.U5 small nuclear ribonucleoprotein component [Candida maltosa Xu316]|uniref:Uncharacterized protein n=1 Tax=Candida maltosa (strain Xu316) TaxID=1245528 RepID=M3IJF3_CANMX|nr:hypothetical protein G210_3248 [Candida maltosa Xu316]